MPCSSPHAPLRPTLLVAARPARRAPPCLSHQHALIMPHPDRCAPPCTSRPVLVAPRARRALRRARRALR
eukprot:2331371-Pleurochrysis_carterae.AAC.1